MLFSPTNVTRIVCDAALSMLLGLCTLTALASCGENSGATSTPATTSQPVDAGGRATKPAMPVRQDMSLPAEGAGIPADQFNTEIKERIAAAFNLIQNRRFNDSRTVLAPVLSSFPNHGKARFILGLSYHKEKKYELARPIFEGIIEYGPSFNEFDTVYHFYGWCLYWLGELDLATLAFEEHLRRDPDEGDSHFGLGVIALEQDHLGEAEAQLRKSIHLQKKAVEGGSQNRIEDVAKGYARLSDVFVRQDNLEEARQALETSIQLYPPHYNAHYRLYRVLLQLGDEEAAQRALEQHDYWKRLRQPGMFQERIDPGNDKDKEAS